MDAYVFFWLAMEAIDKSVILSIVSSNLLLLFSILEIRSYKFWFVMVAWLVQDWNLHFGGNFH